MHDGERLGAVGNSPDMTQSGHDRSDPEAVGENPGGAAVGTEGLPAISSAPHAGGG